MLHITHNLRPSQSRSYFIDQQGMPYSDKKDSESVLISDIQHEGGLYGLKITLHGYNIIDYSSQDGFGSHMAAVNNGFYKLLQASENTFVQGIVRLKRMGDKVFVEQYPYLTPLPPLPPLDLYQAVTEAIRAVKDFKKIMYESVVPYMEDPILFMIDMFGYEEHYTKSRIDDPNFDWLTAVNGEYGSNNHKPYTKIVRSKKITDLPNEDLNIKQTYYVHQEAAWLPLETAWNTYRKEHNITDANIAAAIAKAETNEKNFLKFPDSTQLIP